MAVRAKTALVFAATGAVSAGVARALAQDGAHVHLSARRSEPLRSLAAEIEQLGGKASVAIVDATDEAAVRVYVDGVAKNSGGVDIVFNGIGGRPGELGYPAHAAKMTLAEFMIPLQRIVGSQFLTAREAARHMSRQRSGAIVLLSATLSGGAFSLMSGISAACGAVDALTRALAGEYGGFGVRVNCVRGSAMPETTTIQDTFAGRAALLGDAAGGSGGTLLGRPVTVAETAAAARYLASEAASGITGQVLTVCAGQFV